MDKSSTPELGLLLARQVALTIGFHFELPKEPEAHHRR
jgi:hypothetical protein